MKELLVVVVLFACAATPILAQQDAKLNEVFSEQELSDLSENDPQELAYLKFRAYECYQVQDLSGKKDISELPDISSLNDLVTSSEVAGINASNFSKDHFNPLLYGSVAEVQPAYFRVGESGVSLKIYSEERCRELFKK